MNHPSTSSLQDTQRPVPDDATDVLIIGAGINGLGLLWELRDRGFESLRLIDKAPGVGGTWYWNKYPGARFDSESYSYGFFKDPRLLRDWRWSEHFAGQRETERYLNEVADRFDLRRFIDLNINVETAAWDEGARLWTVTSDDGRTYRSRILATALGILSHPQYPRVEGMHDFGGVSVHTARWPEEGIDLAGKKVAVIGTGSSGIQVIPKIAEVAEQLTVFQRTPNWVNPLNNGPITDEEWENISTRFDEIRKRCSSGYGFLHTFDERSAYDLTPEQRRATYEELWTKRGFAKFLGNFAEVALDLDINNEFREFIAGKIRSIVKDPATAEKLIPTDHPYGGKRTPFGTGYYETYNRPNVNLVSLRDEPIVRVTCTGIQTAATDYELDVIVWATGFDALTGAYDQIEIIGTGGQRLKDVWAEGPWTYMGLQTPGFPNLLLISGPNAIGGNVPRAAEPQVDFAADLLAHMAHEKQTRCESLPEAADRWTEHARSTGVSVLTAKHTDYNWGANTEGKVIAFRGYSGGLDGLRTEIDKSRTENFSGFGRD